MSYTLRSISIFLSFVVLISSTCFGADMHYCKSDLQSVAFFDTAKPCKKMQSEELSPCCKARKMRIQEALKGKTVFKKAKCCHNKSIAYKYDQNANSEIKISVTQLQKINVFELISPIEVYAGFQKQINSFREPPEVLIDRDLQVFYQVFRI